MLSELKNFGLMIRASAQRNPEKLAIVCNGSRYTYSRIEIESNKVASALRARGIRPGDKVAILTPNCAEYMPIVFGIAKLGAVAVKLNWRLAPAELKYLMDFNDVNVLFYRYNNKEWHKRLKSMISHMDMLYISLDRTPTCSLCYEDFIANGSSEYNIEFLSPDEPLMHLHTSGASGKPKTVVYNYRRFLSELDSCIDGLGFTEDLVFLSMSQMFHSASTGIYSCLAVGATAVVFSHFDPQKYLQAVENEHVNRISAIPTVLQSLLEQPNLDDFDLSSVHTIGYSAAPMSPALIDKAIARLHCGFMQSYGMTEMASIVTILQPEDHLRDNYKHLYSVGRPIKGAAIKIIDENGCELPHNSVGRIALQGPGMMVEYYKQPEKTSEVLKDGWYISDDLGWVDDEGFLTLSGRASDLIITGGENVFAQEVENVLNKNDCVEESCVFGSPDNYWGEMVSACVVLKKGAKTTAKELKTYCKEHIAGYKVPKKVLLVSALPKNAVGKIDKPAVVNTYGHLGEETNLEET